MSVVRRLHAPSAAHLVELLSAPAEAPRADATRFEMQRTRRRSRRGGSPRRSPRTDQDRRVRRRARSGAVRHAVRVERADGAAPARHRGAAATRRAGPRRARSDAAHEEIERLCDRAERGLARRGALGTWLAAAPREVRARVRGRGGDVGDGAAATWSTGTPTPRTVSRRDRGRLVRRARRAHDLHGRRDATSRADGRAVRTASCGSATARRASGPSRGCWSTGSSPRCASPERRAAEGSAPRGSSVRGPTPAGARRRPRCRARAATRRAPSCACAAAALGTHPWRDRASDAAVAA